MKSFEYCREAFSERLREFMDDKSILAFSKAIDIPEQTINAWIRKKTAPSMEYLIALAQKFNCSIDYLVGLTDNY